MATMNREILLDTAKRSVIKFTLPETGGYANQITGSISPSELTGFNRGNINETPELGISRIQYCLSHKSNTESSPWLCVGWGITAQSPTGSTGSIFLHSSGVIDFSSIGCLFKNPLFSEVTYYAVLGITVVTSGTFNSLRSTAYHLTGPSITTSDYSGTIVSFTGAATGPTGSLTISYPFSSGVTAGTFSGVTGYMSLSSTGNGRYLVTTPGTVYTGSLYDGSVVLYNNTSFAYTGYVILELSKIKGYGVVSGT